tara:strand:+ start:325 stop:546 length:222 start_codon:yes stop_codon:yes gene_type:complete
MNYMTPGTSGVISQNCSHFKKPRRKYRGLGDVLTKIFEKTGVKRVVNKATNGKCGCQKRADKLNKWFPIGDHK